MVDGGPTATIFEIDPSPELKRRAVALAEAHRMVRASEDGRASTLEDRRAKRIKPPESLTGDRFNTFVCCMLEATRNDNVGRASVPAYSKRLPLCLRVRTVAPHSAP